MSKMCLKNVQETAEKFNSDLEELKKELKRVQSVKCRLKAQKMRKDYTAEMTKTLQYEQLLKEAKDYLEPKKVTVTTMTVEDISILTYDETIKAIKSIQSKKCHSQWLENKEIYEDACRIEQQLLAHKSETRPIDESVVKKTDVKTFITEIENLEEVSKEYILEMLKKMI